MIAYFPRCKRRFIELTPTLFYEASIISSDQPVPDRGRPSRPCAAGCVYRLGSPRLFHAIYTVIPREKEEKQEEQT